MSDALVLNIVSRVANNILLYDIQVVEQKYRCGSFSKYSSNVFTASNGFKLQSVATPAGTSINGDGMCVRRYMYLRGSTTSDDNNIITVDSTAYVDDLKEAVKEYNEYMRGE